MTSVAVCYAAADSGLMRTVADYLQTHLDVKVEDAPVSAWLDLLESAESASAADRVIVLLSNASVPEKLPRERWDAITSPAMAWVLLEECPISPLLNRRAFFDYRERQPAILRALWWWIVTGESKIKGESPYEAIFQQFVDAPGRLELLDLRAVEAARRYFNVSVVVDTRHRTESSMVAEIADALDLKRSSDHESLLADMQRAVASRRTLVVWHGPDPGLIVDPGRTSLIHVPWDEEPAPADPVKMRSIVHDCEQGRAEPPAWADLDRALSEAFASGDWPVARDLAKAAGEYLRAEYRLAEAYGVLESLKKGAEFFAEHELAAECRRDLVWIADRWALGATSGDEELEQLGFDW